MTKRPPPKKNYEPCCLESLAHLPIEPIADLREAAQSMAMVTDVSSRIWEYAFAYKKPAILCLLGFSDRGGDDRLSKLIDLFAVSVFSLAELAKTIEKLPELVANSKIILQGRLYEPHQTRNGESENMGAGRLQENCRSTFAQ